MNNNPLLVIAVLVTASWLIAAVAIRALTYLIQ